VADVADFDFGQNTFDLIASIYEPDWNWAAKIHAGLSSALSIMRIKQHGTGRNTRRVEL